MNPYGVYLDKYLPAYRQDGTEGPLRHVRHVTGYRYAYEHTGGGSKWREWWPGVGTAWGGSGRARLRQEPHRWSNKKMILEHHLHNVRPH